MTASEPGVTAPTLEMRSRSDAFWPLFKLTLDNTYGLTAARQLYLVQKRRLWEPLLIAFAVLTAGGGFEFVLYKLDEAFTAAGRVVGQPEIVFTFSFLVASMLVFLFGLLAVISVFYFSNDLEVLVPLPLRPGTIILAKFGAVALGEYIGVLLAMVPAAVAYAAALGGGLSYWLSVVLVIVLGPVLPLALASAVSVVVMRFINRRHRDILIVVFASLYVVGVLAFQMTVMNSVPQNATSEFLQRVLAGQISLVNLLGRSFPPAVWATVAIAGSTVGRRAASAAALVAVSAAAVWVMGAVGSRFFYGGLIGGSEVARRHLTARQAEAARAAERARIVQTSPVAALFRREWRLFMRVPLYVFNGFSASLIVPVIFIFGFRGVMTDPDVVRLVQAIQSSGDAGFFLTLGVAALTVLLVSLNTTASSAVSREGSNLWISKVIPVRPEHQVQGKLLFAMAAALVSAVPVLVLFGIALKMSFAHLLEATLLSLEGSFIVTAVGLFIDATRPYLKWTNPQQAVKGNLNVILPLPVVVGLVVGLYYLALWLRRGLGLSELTVTGVLAVVLAGLGAAAYRLTILSAARLYDRLEV